MKLVRILFVLALLLAEVAVLDASKADASPTQATMLQDDGDLLYGSPALRDSRLDEFKSLGVDIVKVRVRWRDVAPTRPNNPSDPASYGASWDPYQAIIDGASARGMGVLFQLGGTAPEWATAGKGPVNRPSPTAFKNFVQAVGSRFPQVTTFSVWNEPNLVSWLAPQVKGGVPQSPRIYRNLLNAAASGLAASGHSGGELLLGELLPFARSSREAKKRTRPLAFLRELACVDRKYRPFRGSTAKKRGCKGFKALPGTGLAYHPYTLAGGPNVRTPHPDDASIRDLSRVTRVLSKLGSKKRLQTRSMPIWITEFGFQTNPPDRYASPIKKVPGFMGQSEFIAFKNRRVASYSQYPLIDDKGRDTGFQSGLRFSSGKKKKGVFDAFRHPFWAHRSGSRVELFGGVRAASGGTVTLESKVGRKGKWKALGTVTMNSRGYFDKGFRPSSPSKRYFRFKAEGVTSRVATASTH